MERIIKVSVKNKIAKAPDDALYICGNSDFVLAFDFDDEWDGYDHKTARFIYNGTHEDKIFTGSQCAIPIIANTHTIKVGVYAGNLSTTTPALISASKSILCDNPPPADPLPDVYNQLMAKLNELSEKAVSPEEITDAVEAALVQAKESGEFDGKDGRDGVDGKDGYTPVKNVDYFDGEPGTPGRDGDPGKDGQPGKDGSSVTVSAVSESTVDGGTNVVTFSDGKTLNIKNGKAGTPGKDGTNGKDGKDGYTPQKGVDYFDGEDGKPGEPGAPGKDGAKGDPGYTPQRGTDYWTAADQTQIVSDVLAALTNAEGVTF